MHNAFNIVHVYIIVEYTLLEMGSSGNSINRVPVTGQIKLPWIVIATPIGVICYPSGSKSNYAQ